MGGWLRLPAGFPKPEPFYAAGLVMLAGCASVDQSKAQKDLEIASLAVTTAKAIVVTTCAASPDVPPCSSAGAMAEIAKAGAVLDTALAQARTAIAAASTDDQLAQALAVLQAAVAVYAKVVQTYGVRA